MTNKIYANALIWSCKTCSCQSCLGHVGHFFYTQEMFYNRTLCMQYLQIIDTRKWSATTGYYLSSTRRSCNFYCWLLSYLSAARSVIMHNLKVKHGQLFSHQTCDVILSRCRLAFRSMWRGGVQSKEIFMYFFHSAEFIFKKWSNALLCLFFHGVHFVTSLIVVNYLYLELTRLCLQFQELIQYL